MGLTFGKGHMVVGFNSVVFTLCQFTDTLTGISRTRDCGRIAFRGRGMAWLFTGRTPLWKRLVRFSYDESVYDWSWLKEPRPWVLRIDFGRGAGYMWGRTFFIAQNSGSLRWRKNFTHDPEHHNTPKRWYDHILIDDVEFGFTDNANLVPYAGE